MLAISGKYLDYFKYAYNNLFNLKLTFAAICEFNYFNLHWRYFKLSKNRP